MSEILEQLEVNQTFFLEFGLFVVFFFALSAIYLKPFQKIIEARSQRLKNDVEGATELLKTVENKLQEYEKSLLNIRNEAKAEHDKVILDAKTREDQALAKHKDELKKEYQKVLEQFQGEKSKIETELSAQVASMSDAITQKVLMGK